MKKIASCSPDDDSTLCQADGCDASSECVCDAWVVTPPFLQSLFSPVMLCARHARVFAKMKQLSVILDPTNLDSVSVARWGDNHTYGW